MWREAWALGPPDAEGFADDDGLDADLAFADDEPASARGALPDDDAEGPLDGLDDEDLVAFPEDEEPAAVAFDDRLGIEGLEEDEPLLDVGDDDEPPVAAGDEPLGPLHDEDADLPDSERDEAALLGAGGDDEGVADGDVAFDLVELPPLGPDFDGEALFDEALDELDGLDPEAPLPPSAPRPPAPGVADRSPPT